MQGCRDAGMRGEVAISRFPRIYESKQGLVELFSNIKNAKIIIINAKIRLLLEIQKRGPVGPCFTISTKCFNRKRRRSAKYFRA